jgi:hypothetical protein
MDSTRPKRAIRKPTRYLDSRSQIAPTVEAVAKKANRAAAKSALKPVAAEPLPDPQVLEEYLPPYTPPYQLQYIIGESVSRANSELETFKKFISDDVVNIITAATNAYAEADQNNQPFYIYARPWKSIS